ncbi:hypothetical protein FVE85_4491 [Porphyridium purpureum]|uniref:Uncharacterized protein n=1 Tax=Porphyridium purpureum TaxID=35688 RepID=A0A5J4YJZ2_PORPP|nr:hypothetical protein FVE85_4491 [Porphyridium purpureum]|eukprot:POR5672..scf297_16
MAGMSGIQFPAGEDGERSTLRAGSDALAAAVKGVDAELAEQITRSGKKFRFEYAKYYVRMNELSAVSKANALEIARAGLEHLHGAFEYVHDGKAYSLAEAMKTISGSFDTMEIHGTVSENAIPSRLDVPYGKSALFGPVLSGKLREWAQRGTIEPSAAAAIRMVAENGKWLDLRGKYFVLLGAGSAMGPLPFLLSCGANVIAIDLDRPQIWERIIGVARASPGTLIFPVKQGSQPKTDEELFAAAGCNLFTQTPQILNWLVGVKPEQQLIVGTYAYLDGAKHVQVALAMDAIVQGLLQERGDIFLASLGTPTDTYAIPEDAYNASIKNFNERGALEKLFQLNSKWCVKNARKPVKAADGTDYYICDTILSTQGPNYTLAKRVQLWRAMLTREDAGCAVSLNIAPSTSTKSVMIKKEIVWVLSGISYFAPMEVFEQETSNVVMAALLVHDLNNKQSVAYKSAKSLGNPLELFLENAFHGGTFRMAYKMESAAVPAAIVHLASANAAVLGLILLLVVVFVGLVAAKLPKLV